MQVTRRLNHLGVLVTVVAAILGSTHLQKLQMTVSEGATQRVAFSDNDAAVEPGFAIELHGTPRRFASDISVYPEEGPSVRATVEVNHPLKVGDWYIYQYGSDILLLVKDPWLPAVYVGIILMMAGALAVLVTRIRGKKQYLLSLGVLLLAGLFTYFFTPVFKTRSMAPALQSPWFIPHVVVYMIAYAVLAVATVAAFWPRKELELTDQLVYAGAALLTIGMLLGAIWAKQAWGHYWTWDPKETWAAVTWLCYWLYLHLRKFRPRSGTLARWILVLAFLCLQMCWWGVKFLPGSSLHVYN